MIAGVAVKRLDVHLDERGFVAELLREDEPLFERFGQVYVTSCRHGVAKAWHHHARQVDFFACAAGRALVVLYDPRQDSLTSGRVQEIVIEAPGSAGEDGRGTPALVKVPALVIHGVTALDCEEAVLVNVATHSYDRASPDKVRLPWNSHDVPYRWPSFVRAGG